MPPAAEALEKIATGGTATVFVAARTVQPGVRSLVAVKRLHPHLCEDPKERQALLDEASLLARIRHPHVVGLHDARIESDRVELWIDYVEGASLSELLVAAAHADERLSQEVVLRIVLDACAGLAAIHAAKTEEGEPLGIVHRDVSPQNVLVGVDGFARIADLGTAKVHAGDRSSTTVGTLKGKLGYMAPEYVSRGQCDVRVDVFAMGVVLWEALAARRLFKGSNEGETLHKIEHEAPALVSTVAPDVGPELAAVVARALAKAPEDRYQDIESLARALREAGPSVEDARDAVRRAVLAYAGDKIDSRRKLEQAALARATLEEETVTRPVTRHAASRGRVVLPVVVAAAGLAAAAIYATTRSTTEPMTASTPPSATQEASSAPKSAPTTTTAAATAEAPPAPEPVEEPENEPSSTATSGVPVKVGGAKSAASLASASAVPSAQRRRPPPNPY